jgi:hypothetical protein
MTTLLASENMLRVERAVTRGPCGVKPPGKHADGRPARHSFHRVLLYSGCDSAWQQAGKCRAGRGGSMCHADHTSGQFALGQEPSRCPGLSWVVAWHSTFSPAPTGACRFGQSGCDLGLAEHLFCICYSRDTAQGNFREGRA